MLSASPIHFPYLSVWAGLFAFILFVSVLLVTYVFLLSRLVRSRFISGLSPDLTQAAYAWNTSLTAVDFWRTYCNQGTLFRPLGERARERERERERERMMRLGRSVSGRSRTMYGAKEKRNEEGGAKQVEA